MNEQRKPYPKNVAGDFYVEDGCCTACDVPNHYAPGLFEYDDESHCFVARQPETNREIYQMIKAVCGSEVECIRYKGDDREILRRLAEAGQSDLCDQPKLVRGIKPLRRNHVAFELGGVESETQLALRFREHILHKSTEYTRYKATAVKKDDSGAAFKFCWYENNYHRVGFGRTNAKDVWHAFHSPVSHAAHSIILTVDEWLRGNREVANIRWYTETAWRRQTDDWQNTPI